MLVDIQALIEEELLWKDFQLTIELESGVEVDVDLKITEVDAFIREWAPDVYITAKAIGSCMVGDTEKDIVVVHKEGLDFSDLQCEIDEMNWVLD